MERSGRGRVFGVFGFFGGGGVHKVEGGGGGVD